MLGKELGRAEVWVLFARKAPSPPTTSSLTVLDFSADPAQHTCSSQTLVPQGQFPERFYM